jgi:hypothetical protein
MRSVDMPPIGTVEEAIRAGEAFVGRYYAFKKPLEARKEGDTWLVVFDVGVFHVQRLRLRIDANSGLITEYTAPQSL